MLTNSWIIVSRDTGKAVHETYNERVAAAINTDKYKVMTSYAYLVQFNQSVKRSA